MFLYAYCAWVICRGRCMSPQAQKSADRVRFARWICCALCSTTHSAHVPVCSFQHPQQFHDFSFSQARAKLGQSPARLSHLPPDSSRGTKEIFRRNQSIVEAIGSCTFQFQQTWNPNPTIWSSLDNPFWQRQHLHIQFQPTTHHDWQKQEELPRSDCVGRFFCCQIPFCN